MSLNNYEERLMKKFTAGDKKAIDEVVKLFYGVAEMTSFLILLLNFKNNQEEIERRKSAFLQDIRGRLINNYAHYDTLKNVREQYSNELKLLINKVSLSAKTYAGAERFRASFNKFFETIEQMPAKQGILTRYFFTKIDYKVVTEKLHVTLLEVYNQTDVGLLQLNSCLKSEIEENFLLSAAAIRKN